MEHFAEPRVWSSPGSIHSVTHESMTFSGISRASIAATSELIRTHVRVTPVIEVDGEQFGLDRFRLSVKLESLQHSGSFKVRGAFANMRLRDIPSVGVVAASGGNHGAAVAYAAMRLGVPAKVFVPRVSSPAKVERIRAYGADLVVDGDRYADALAASEVCAATIGAARIHAFDQVETLLGQGTLGVELSEQVPDLDTVLIAVGGGGLIGGVASWFNGSVRVVGVEPEGAPTLTQALAAGRPVDAVAGSIAADSLAPRRVGELMFPIAQSYVDRVALVDDEAIRQAQAALWDVLRVVAEPGAAAPLAALLTGSYVPRSGEHIAIVVSGGNTTAVSFDRPARGQ
jgi:threonine dehydratase